HFVVDGAAAATGGLRLFHDLDLGRLLAGLADPGLGDVDVAHGGVKVHFVGDDVVRGHVLAFHLALLLDDGGAAVNNGDLPTGGHDVAVGFATGFPVLAGLRISVHSDPVRSLDGAV